MSTFAIVVVFSYYFYLKDIYLKTCITRKKLERSEWTANGSAYR